MRNMRALWVCITVGLLFIGAFYAGFLAGNTDWTERIVASLRAAIGGAQAH